MPKYPTMAKADKQWAAECDAGTLAEAEKIKGDKARFESAQEAAARKAKIPEEEAENLKRVASGKISYSAMPKEKD